MKFKVLFKNRRESWWEEFDIPRVKTLAAAKEAGREAAAFFNAIIDRPGMLPKTFVKAEPLSKREH
jgi:hypothetical protein